MKIMRFNLKNVCYPKPILSSLSDDFKNNVFEIKIVDELYDKKSQKLYLTIHTSTNNKYINELIKEGRVVPILHLEQKTQREPSVLKNNEDTKKEIDLYQYSTTEPIEVLGLLYCKDAFDFYKKDELNEVYNLLDDKIIYDRGDILGYSNNLSIKLPEDKRIGSIFNVVKDNDCVLNGQPFSVSLDGEMIQILVDSDIHEKYVMIYNNDQFVKRLMFSSMVEPAIITAYTEMFYAYDTYKEKKWCRTLSSKIEQKERINADELFIWDNYEVAKVYEYTNCALGDLYKDAVNTYAAGMEG
jgi:hypothetical protein